MTYASNFERDCPPGAEGIVDNGSIVIDCFDRYKIKVPFKSNIKGERIISFSSKSELDAELKSIFHDSDIGEEELKFVRHLINPLKIPEQYFETTETIHGERNTRKKKGKRGKSLEREIAQLIHKESLLSNTKDLNLIGDIPSNGKLSTTDILSDLTSLQSKKTQECSDFDNSSIIGHSNKCQLDVMSHNGEMEAASNASSSDIFQFKKEEEWTAFDDCPKFTISLLPTQALDKNGFPTSCGAENLNDGKEIVNNIEMKTEFLEPQSAPAKDIKEKDTKPKKEISLHANKKRERCDNNTEKLIGTEEVEQFISEEYTHQQEDICFQVGRKLMVLQNTRNKSNGGEHESVDNGTRNEAGQSSSSFPQDETSDVSSEAVNRSIGFFMSSIEHSHKFESPSSPSSVTDFGHKQGSNRGFKNLVATPNKHLSGAFPISRPKPVWNPKPPEHYNHSSCEI